MEREQLNIEWGMFDQLMAYIEPELALLKGLTSLSRLRLLLMSAKA